VAGHDLVIVSLGNSQNPFALMLGARRTTPRNVCETGTSHIIAAMQATGIARLLVVTAFGIGDTRANLPLAFRLFYRTVLREHMADKEKQEALVKSSGLDWTLVQPVGLTDKPATNTWLADTSGVIRRQQMSRADVAAFLVSLLPSKEYSRATIALSG
jgi:putative NADH-flavin reductase